MMGKETKIGLAVIAVLLAVFVFVLFRKFWGAGAEEVAAAEPPTKSASANKLPPKTPATSSKTKAPSVTAKSPASAWSSNREPIGATDKSGKASPSVKSSAAAPYDNPFRAVNTPTPAPAAKSSTAAVGFSQQGASSGKTQATVAVSDPPTPVEKKPEPSSPWVTTPAATSAATSSTLAATSPPPVYSPFHQPPATASDSSATAGDIPDAAKPVPAATPSAAVTDLAANNAYDPVAATQPAAAESLSQSARRAPALLDQTAAANQSAIEPIAAQGYAPPAQPGHSRSAAPRTSPSGYGQQSPYAQSPATQYPASASSARSTASDLSQADAYNAAGGSHSRAPAQQPPRSYEQSGLARPSTRPPLGQHYPDPMAHESAVELGPDRRYIVQPNDNYWSISQKVFGTGAFFKAILQHQRDRGRAIDEHLQPGEVLAIPPAELLVKDYPHLCPRQPVPSAAASQMVQVSAPRRPQAGRGMYYVVEEGDTLFDIARYELGHATRWVEIYDLNRDQIGEDFDHLKPGVQLILPGESLPESVTQMPPRTLQR